MPINTHPALNRVQNDIQTDPPRGWKNALFATGQLTQYSGELDDGYYRKGDQKSYTILTTGPQAGASNIDLIHLSASTISFDSSGSTINDSASQFSALGFSATTVVVVTNSASNNKALTVQSVSGSGTLIVTGGVTTESAGAAVSLAKREAHSNNIVIDNNTGLMWLRYAADKMGPASDGIMPWTGQLYDIFQYADAANAAQPGGYNDWRVPSDLELKCLCDMEQPTAAPDPTAFPSWPTSDYFWSATTRPNVTSVAMIVSFYGGDVGVNTRTYTYFCALVRG